MRAKRWITPLAAGLVVYAVPLAGSGRAPVWTAPVTGEMIVTADGILIVAHRAAGRTSGSTIPTELVAYRLR